MLLALFCFLLLHWAAGGDDVHDGRQVNELFGHANDTHLNMVFGAVTRKEYMAAPSTESDQHLLMFDEIVMARDETDGIAEYIRDLVPEPGLAVLEIGFGMGISSGLIQDAGCARHTIVEANAGVMKRLIDWRVEKREGVVTPIFGFWEDTLGQLRDESFDAVWFDPHPSFINPHFVREARRLLRPGGRLSFFLSLYDEAHVASSWQMANAILVEAGWRPDDEIASPRIVKGEVMDDCGHRYNVTSPSYRNDTSSATPKCRFRSLHYVLPKVVKNF